MDALAAYDSSGEEDEPREQEEAPPIDPAESSSVLSKLSEKFLLNSAPTVPIRVRSRGYGVGAN